ncbi:MAG: Ribosomal small subunit methyltransferase [Myxococcaceae bacterium]|nr:Ribosomal small subunit methyltransferase [Myxococcaceae bacterium]
MSERDRRPSAPPGPRTKHARESPLTGARGVATIVLHRVATDAAYATRALDAEITSAGLEPRDARLATEIVYGTLRMLPEIDERLDRHLTRGRPDPFTVAALRAATYQALALSRVPSFAIVQETVALVKHKRGEGLAKLTNAVMRRIVADRPENPAPAAKMTVPGWVETSLQRGIGEQRMRAYLELTQRPPPLSLRVRPGLDRAALATSLREALPEAELRESDLTEDAILAWGVGDPRKLPGYAEGSFAVQDEGAELVGRLAGAQRGERVLDACAGRGGKTLQLLEAVGPEGHVTAVDVHARKLEQLHEEVLRLGYDASRVATETIDLSVGDGGLEGKFDRILVDAPCTGLGTLRRRPEILLRLRPEDPARMAALQLRILRCAAGLLRPGGVLVFAVCSATLEEGRGIAEALESRMPGLKRLTHDVPEVSVACDADGVFRIGPWLAREGGCPDVYQVVRWEMLDRLLAPV